MTNRTLKAISPLTSIEKLEAKIGYIFSDKNLLSNALTHQSSLDESDFVEKGNQRLEFLGDRILGLVISDYLYTHSQDFPEGELAPRLNMLVSKQACARSAKKISLGNHVILGLSEAESGGRMKESILGDACEALIAAIYRDGGLEKARSFILEVWDDQLNEVEKRICAKDPKTLLQEFVQSKKGDRPNYKVVKREGPDHSPEFTVELRAMGWTSIGVASSKQKAERAAASVVLRELRKELGE